jgi:DNA-binding CsgD family transcriptional regulator/transposase-like protein
MARKKEGSISESKERLEALLALHRGSPRELRLRMLALVQTEPMLTLAEAAAHLGCSERTLRRWWGTYQREGLDALLGDVVADGHHVPECSPSAQLVSGQLQEFLNDLPVTADTIEWIDRFRNALMRLLEDVDRITVNVDTECDLYASNSSRLEFFQTEHIPDAHSPERTRQLSTQRMDRPPGELLLEEFARRKFPLHEYHSPCCFDYYVASGAYLGTIFLWRGRNAPPVSDRTLDAMHRLESFIIFLLSDCVTRNRHRRPGLRLFGQIIDSLAEAEGLTVREKEVMGHHLLGRRYGEIAGNLNIAISTVRKHVIAIHQKTGARTYTELFARYFSDEA